MKQPLDMGLAVWIADRMGHELHPEALSELFHRGGDHRPWPAAGSHQDTGIVDGTARAGPAEEGDCRVEEHLGLEAGKARVVLDEGATDASPGRARRTGP
jgi:hypothetical protein